MAGIYFHSAGGVPLPPEGESIEHTAYLFPSNDGLVENERVAPTEVWSEGTADDVAYEYLNSVGAGIQQSTTTQAILPGQDWFDWSGFGYTDTGETRIFLRTRCLGSMYEGDTVADYARAKISLSTNIPELSTAVFYIDRAEVIHQNDIMNEYDTYDGVEAGYTFYEPSDGNFYAYVGGSDYTGRFVQWDMDAHGFQIGSSCHAHTEVWTREFRQQRLFTTGGDIQTWSEMYDATTGTTADNSSSNSISAIQSKAVGELNWTITRSFFEFDFSNFDSTRTVTSSTFIPVKSAGDDINRAVAYQGTQASILTTADYDSFTGSAITTSTGTAWTSDINMEFNAGGISYAQTQVDASSSLKLCVREYGSDVGEVIAGGDIALGMYFSGQAPTVSGIFEPRLKLVYNKVPEWTDRTSDTYWTANTGSYSGGWSSSGSTLDISETGSWEVGYRPVGIKVTCTAEVNLNLYDADGEVIVTDSTYTSEDASTIVWRGTSTTYDIDRLVMTAGGDFTVTKIEFLEL